MVHKDNPFRGSLEGEWYHVVLHIEGFGTTEFLCESPYFFSQSPCLLGTNYPIMQVCTDCKKKIDDEDKVFVVHRLRKAIDYHFISKLAFKLDEDDFMCSKEKLPKLLEWQMAEHKKTCERNPSQPTA